jgi:hypothetical protein
MQVVALATASYSVFVSGSCSILSVPQSSMAGTICNVDANRTPLEAMFEKRFDNDWTRAREDQLLSEAVKKAAVPDHDLFNLVHTAQHESLAEDALRLTEGDVLRIARRKA